MAFVGSQRVIGSVRWMLEIANVEHRGAEAALFY